MVTEGQTYPCEWLIKAWFGRPLSSNVVLRVCETVLRIDLWKEAEWLSVSWENDFQWTLRIRGKNRNKWLKGTEDPGWRRSESSSRMVYSASPQRHCHLKILLQSVSWRETAELTKTKTPRIFLIWRLLRSVQKQILEYCFSFSIAGSITKCFRWGNNKHYLIEGKGGKDYQRWSLLLS